MLLVGDLLQLPPVQSRQIFSPPKDPHNRALWSSTGNLWESFEVVVLDEDKRHGVGSTWTKTLNRIRKGDQTDEDLALLEQRKLKNFPEKLEDGSLDDALHCFFTNKAVYKHNMKMLNKLDQTPLVSIEADVFTPQGLSSQTSEFNTIDDTKFMKTLQIKDGARVMLIHNYDIPDQLVNGLIGTITGFITDTAGVVDAIVVKFDDPNVGQGKRKSIHPNHPLVKDGGVPIKRTTLDYRPKRIKSKKSHQVYFKLIQFPLTLSWASTGHKMQGKTVPRGCDMVCYGGDRRFPKGLGYVMISRCEDIKNLYLDESFDFKKLEPNEWALAESKKLEEKSITCERNAQTFDLYYVNLQNIQRQNFVNLCCDPLAVRSDTVLLAETWFIPNQEPAWSGWDNNYHASVGNGKGVSAYAKKEHLLLGKIQSQEYQILSLQKSDMQLTIVYLSDDATKASVVQSFESFHQSNLYQIVLGDFNFQQNEKNILSEYLTNHLKLRQVVDSSTHEKGGMIDHIYLSDALCVSEIKAKFNIFSDHMGFTIKFAHADKPML